MLSCSDTQIAIVGGGTMGIGIAAIFCAGGRKTHVVEPDAERATMVSAGVDRCIGQMKDSPAPDNLQIHSDLTALPWDRIGLVVECVPEKRSLKQQIFAELERLCKADTVLTSNSSSFPISEIAAGLTSRHRMAGLHFFMPAHLVPLVEVVSSSETDPALSGALCKMMTELDKYPVHVRKDIPGFLANRIQHALMREALDLVERGIASAEDVDAAVQLSFGMRFMGAGPILQKDMAGLDIHCAAATTIYPDLCRATEPSAVLRERVEAGDLGMKSGRGFYEWADEEIDTAKARYAKALMAALKIIES